MPEVLQFILFILGFAITTVIIASSKGRSVLGWTLVSLFFTIVIGIMAQAPLIGGLFNLFTLIILVARPPHHRLSAYAAVEAQGRPIPGLTKSCPGCTEIVPATARICRHCRHEFTATDDRSAEARRQPLPAGTDQAASETGRYRGLDYAVFADGSVVATLRGSLQTWPGLDAFRRDIDRTGLLPP